MTSISRTLFFQALAFSSIAGMLGAFVACTDNGDSTHGPTFGALPKTDGSVSADDGGGPVNGDDSGKNDDGSTNNPNDSSTIEAAAPCTTGTIAVVAGNDTTLSTAIRDKGGAWATQAVPSAAAKSKPAVVSFGAGFLAVTHGQGDVLQSLAYASSAWSAAATIGSSGVKGAPSLAVVGTKAHVVYSAGPNANTDFLHGIHDGAGWNAATAAVGPPPSFGTVSAGVAGVGTDLVFAENGTNNGLYVRTFDTAWSASTAITGAGTVGASIPATPELVAITGGSSALDLVLVYAENTTRRLSFATRTASSKTWSSATPPATNIHADATTAEKIAIAQTSPTTVLVAFRGQDGKGYFSRGTLSGSSVTWTAAIAVGGASAPAVDSTPAVAPGVCADEDAIFVYASGGSVATTRLRGTSWTPAETITNVSGTRVAIATKP